MHRPGGLSIHPERQGIVMVTCAAARVVATVGFRFSDRATFLRAKTQNLIVFGEMIGSNSVAALAFHGPALVRETLTALQAISDLFHACSYDSDGKVFAQVSRNANSLED